MFFIKSNLVWLLAAQLGETNRKEVFDLNTTQTLQEPVQAESGSNNETALAERGVLLVWNHLQRDNRAYHDWKDWIRAFEESGAKVDHVVAVYLAKIEIFERTAGGGYDLAKGVDNGSRPVRFLQSLAHTQDIARIRNPEITYDIVFDVCDPYIPPSEGFLILERASGLARAGHRLHTLVDHRCPVPDFGEQLAASGHSLRYQNSSLFDSIDLLVSRAGLGP